MFIQCQHCQTTYKIDENKIPEKESVVRCTKCSEPIPLSREKQKELLKKSPNKIVECDSCGTQYSVPINTIKKETSKARCGKCGNFFTISRSGENSVTDSSASAKAYEESFQEDDISLENIDIPSESEIEVDDLFGDVEDSSGKQKSNKRSKSATDEYLESVKLSKEGDSEFTDEEIGINEISPDQKYKIFLKPSDKKAKKKNDQADESWPDIEDEADGAELEDEVDLNLPAFDGIDDKTGLPRKKQKNKKAVILPNEKKRSKLLWFIWFLVALALIAVGWIFMGTQTREIYSPPQTETFGKQSKIAILEPLNGRFIKNQLLAERIFVLDGKLLNVYGGDVALSKIEIEGYLYVQDQEQPLTSISFAGESLTDEQLKTWDKIKIESSLMKQSQDGADFKEFGSDDLIDFQVVFFDVPDPEKIYKLVAKIKKFNRRKK